MIETTDAAIVRTCDDIGPLAFIVMNKHDSIQRYHAKGSFYEADDLALISHHVDADGVVWDVGANVGNHTVYLARRFPNCTVVPFEMVPRTCELLRLNVALNGLENVDLSKLGCALGKNPGHCHAYARHANNLGLVRAVLADDGTIPVTTGDSLSGDVRVNFLKIDVEGAELDCLDGMSQLIARDQPVIFIEVDNRNIRAFEDWLQLHRYAVIQTIKRYEVNCNYLIRPND